MCCGLAAPLLFVGLGAGTAATRPEYDTPPVFFAAIAAVALTLAAAFLAIAAPVLRLMPRLVRLIERYKILVYALAAFGATLPPLLQLAVGPKYAGPPVEVGVVAALALWLGLTGVMTRRTAHGFIAVATLIVLFFAVALASTTPVERQGRRP